MMMRERSCLSRATGVGKAENVQIKARGGGFKDEALDDCGCGTIDDS